MPYLISYDIEDDRLRGKIADRLLAVGCIRLQKSVFAGPVGDTDFRKLEQWLRQEITATEDSVFIVDVGPDTLRNTKWIGKEAPDWSLATGPPQVLFI